MKVFVTVGYGHTPFDRLVRLMDRPASDLPARAEVWIQAGTSRYLPRHHPYARFIGFNDVSRRIDWADVVVAHAGVGTVLSCLIQGKVPVVLPRRYARGEHVDDHQVDFAGAMEENRRALVVKADDDLWPTVVRYQDLVKACAPTNRSSGEIALSRYLGGLLDRMSVP